MLYKMVNRWSKVHGSTEQGQKSLFYQIRDTHLRTRARLFWAQKTDGLRGEVSEAIYVKTENPYLNRGGGRLHESSATYNAVLSTLLGKLYPRDSFNRSV